MTPDELKDVLLVQYELMKEHSTNDPPHQEWHMVGETVFCSCGEAISLPEILEAAREQDGIVARLLRLGAQFYGELALWEKSR